MYFTAESLNQYLFVLSYQSHKNSRHPTDQSLTPAIITIPTMRHLSMQQCRNNIMITITVPFDNTLNQKTYENTINSLQFHQLQRTCGHSGCLTIHGYYTRSLKADDSVIPLSICRVKCSQCGKTHALPPSLLVPYSQVSLQDQVSIISTYEDSGDYGDIMEKTPSIDENLIASTIRRYVKHWLQKIRSFRLKLSFTPHLVKQCFSFFMNQFMQIRQTPNILFLTPT